MVKLCVVRLGDLISSFGLFVVLFLNGNKHSFISQICIMKTKNDV